MASRDDELRSIIQARFAAARVKNPRFSARSFAKKLGVGAATMTRILNGTSKLSESTTERLVARLGLKESEASHVLDGDRDGRFAAIDPDEDGRLFAELWYHSAIANLSFLPQSKMEPGWLARRLGIAPAEAEDAMARLFRLGFLYRNDDGRVVCREMTVSTTFIARPANRIDRNLTAKVGLLNRALHITTPEYIASSDISTMTFLGNTAQVPKAKEKIKAFRRGLSRFMGAGEPNDVFMMVVSVFPIPPGGDEAPSARDAAPAKGRRS